MDSYTFNHQFLCKLLGICANHAIIEEAYKTQETIQNITELVRYIYDPRKGTILLEEEFKATKNYIRIHNMRGMNKTISLEKHGDDSADKYICHLSILRHIIEDIEDRHSDSEENIEDKYIFDCHESEIELKKEPGNIRIACIKLEN